MKKIIFSLLLLLFATAIFPQIPQGFKYQALIKDESGEVIADQDVSMKINILQTTPTGNVVYSEKHGIQRKIVSQYNSDTLFVVKDSLGNPVFAVFPDGVKVYVNEGSKGPLGGFAVSGRNTSKKANETSSLMRLTSDNYLIGHQSGSSITTGKYNSFLGYQAGILSSSGNKNVLLGYKSGFNLSSGSSNVFIGNNSGYSLDKGMKEIEILKKQIKKLLSLN